VLEKSGKQHEKNLAVVGRETPAGSLQFDGKGVFIGSEVWI